MAVGGGIDFVASDQIDAAAQEAGFDATTSAALVADYEEAQLQALKAGLLVTLFLTLGALLTTRDLPHETPVRRDEPAAVV